MQACARTESSDEQPGTRLSPSETTTIARSAASGSGRVAGDRDDARALFAGALGDELFDPEPERRERLREDQRQLVAASLRRRGHECSQNAPWVCRDVRHSARRLHLARSVEDCRDVCAHQCGWNHTEQGQRGVAAADVRRVDEDVAEPFGERALVQRGAFVGDRDESRTPSARCPTLRGGDGPRRP